MKFLQELEQLKAEEVNENYYRRANSAFRKSLILGEYKQGETIPQISSQDKSGGLDRFLDFFKEPKAAISWISTYLMDKLAGNWLGDLLGYSNKLKNLKTQLLSSINNPKGRADQLVQGLLNHNFFKKDLQQTYINNFLFHYSSLVEEYQNNSQILAKLELSNSLIIFQKYLTENPEASITSSPQDRLDEEFWKSLFQKANIQVSESQQTILIKLFKSAPLYTLKRSFEDIDKHFINPEASENSESNEQEKNTPLVFDDRYNSRLYKFKKAQQESNNDINQFKKDSPYKISSKDGILEKIHAQYYLDLVNKSSSNLTTQIEVLVYQNSGILTLATAFGTIKNPTTILNLMKQTSSASLNLGLALGKNRKTETLLVLSILYLTYKYLEENPMVPFNHEDLKEGLSKYIQQKVDNLDPALKDQLGDQNINKLKEQCDDLIEFILNEEEWQITEETVAKGFIDKLTESGNPVKQIESANKGLLITAKQKVQQQINLNIELTPALQPILDLLSVLHKTPSKLLVDRIQEFNNRNSLFQLKEEGSFIYLQGLKDSPIEFIPPLRIMISPFISEKEQEAASRDFSKINSDTGILSNFFNALGQGLQRGGYLLLSEQGDAGYSIGDSAIKWIAAGPLFYKGLAEKLSEQKELNLQLIVYEIVNETGEAIGSTIIIGSLAGGVLNSVREQSILKFFPGAGLGAIRPITAPIKLTADVLLALNPLWDEGAVRARARLSASMRPTSTLHISDAINKLSKPALTRIKFNQFNADVQQAIGIRSRLLNTRTTETVDNFTTKRSKFFSITNFPDLSPEQLQYLETEFKKVNSPRALKEFRDGPLVDVMRDYYSKYTEYKLVGAAKSAVGKIKQNILAKLGQTDIETLPDGTKTHKKGGIIHLEEMPNGTFKQYTYDRKNLLHSKEYAITTLPDGTILEIETTRDPQNNITDLTHRHKQSAELTTIITHDPQTHEILSKQQRQKLPDGTFEVRELNKNNVLQSRTIVSPNPNGNGYIYQVLDPSTNDTKPHTIMQINKQKQIISGQSFDANGTLLSEQKFKSPRGITRKGAQSHLSELIIFSQTGVPEFTVEFNTRGLPTKAVQHLPNQATNIIPVTSLKFNSSTKQLTISNTPIHNFSIPHFRQPRFHR